MSVKTTLMKVLTMLTMATQVSSTQNSLYIFDILESQEDPENSRSFRKNKAKGVGSKRTHNVVCLLDRLVTRLTSPHSVCLARAVLSGMFHKPQL